MQSRWRQACTLEEQEEDSDWVEAESTAVGQAVLEAARRNELSGEAARALSVLDRATRAWTAHQPSFSVMTYRLRQLRSVAAVEPLNDDEIERLDAVFGLVVLTANEEFALRLQGEALSDPLTGIGNRRALEVAWQAAILQGKRLGQSVCIVAIDLDGLKRINDSRGHAAGDEAIVGLAAALRGALRDTDRVFRIGGDEFVALLPGTAAPGVGELMARVAEFHAPRFSWGAADTIQDGRTLRAVLGCADQRLYARRRQARPAMATPAPAAVKLLPEQRQSALVPALSRRRGVELAFTGLLALMIGGIVMSISSGNHSLCAQGLGSTAVNCGLSNAVYYAGIVLIVVGGLVLGIGLIAAALLRGTPPPD